MERAKWIPAVNRRERSNNRIKWEELISVFVSNMPEEVAVEWLWKSFSSFRKVADAFIPASSRRGKGFCFGFMRFEDRKEADRAIQMLNGSNCGGWKIVVKIASFGWSQRSFTRGTRPSTQRGREGGEDSSIP